jgi:acylphosphatase
MVARRVRVTGRVQGVFFRAWTREQARELGVSGWVRNCSDGSVEAHAEGDAEAIDRLIELLRKGPSGARVDHLNVDDAKPQDLSDFEVRH